MLKAYETDLARHAQDSTPSPFDDRDMPAYVKALYDPVLHTTLWILTLMQPADAPLLFSLFSQLDFAMLETILLVLFPPPFPPPS